MQRAIAAEAALAAAVVAGEVDLTAEVDDAEGEQVQADDAGGDDQAEGGSRAGVGTRRSAPLRTDDDEEVHMPAHLFVILAVCIRNKEACRCTLLQRHFSCSFAGPVNSGFSFLQFAVVMITCLPLIFLLGFSGYAIPQASVKHC